MNEETKIKLAEAWKYCDVEDKSSEFMLEYMQSCANVSLDTVLEFLQMYESWTDILQPK